MARRSTFQSTINAMARESARKERAAQQDVARNQRAREKAARDAERQRKLQSVEEKKRYLESRADEADEMNEQLKATMADLGGILQHTLSVNDLISFESLRSHEAYLAPPIPQQLTLAANAPHKEHFLSRVKPPSVMEKALGMKGRYQRELQAAEEQYATALHSYEASEAERKEKLNSLLAKHEEERKAFQADVDARNQEVDQLERDYRTGDVGAVITYNAMVLERSDYPDGFPQSFRLAYSPEPKELVIEYELPTAEVIPEAVEYKYNKTKDEIDEKPRKSAEIKDVYQDIVASISLRTIHEVLEADQANLVLVIAFNGFVATVDPATGRDVRPCLVSVRTTREQFDGLNLARVDKRTCLRNLGAQVSPQPQAMQPVKPIVEFDMVDKRFVEQADVLSELESRPNLMDLSPNEFESLVSNMFQKMGLETRQTRASRDGGVDVVAFDLRPVLGGKVVIQAKRYRNTVGVSAVRDLYGTMLNEGANKGIIVSTSSYGPDAYSFAKDKPIEMIDGGGLLYLLEQIGTKARIVMPVEN